MTPLMPPQLIVDTNNPKLIRVEGAWKVQELTREKQLHHLEAQLAQLTQPDLQWDLTGLTECDHIGGHLLWQTWGRQLPQQLRLNPKFETLFERLQSIDTIQPAPTRKDRLTRMMKIGTVALRGLDHAASLMILLGQLVLDLIHLVRHPRQGPWKEISANIYHMGARAVGITALVGCLIGIVLSYLSAQQLRTFGADIFIVNILGLSIIRELGPMLAAVLVAGRTGSAITAQIGVMRVTEELDAMRVMGIPQGFRLIMPKVLALAIVMPLLVIWTDVVALIGGMMSANALLDMAPAYFLYKLPEAVPMINFWIGLLKGSVFGILIGLVACHFGLRIQPNTESLGQGTTTSVVTAITIVIIANAIFAIIFSTRGIA